MCIRDRDIEDQYGETHMEERSYRFTAEEKARIHRMLLEEQKLPQLPFEVSRVSYQDGCKVYFKNGGWVSARFSGTEPQMCIRDSHYPNSTELLVFP